MHYRLKYYVKNEQKYILLVITNLHGKHTFTCKSKYNNNQFEKNITIDIKSY